MRTSARQAPRNYQKGSSLIEFASMSLILVVVTVIALNAFLALMAARTNDTACRSAARTAAQGKDPTSATNLANAMLAKYTAGSYYGAPQLTNLTKVSFN